MTRARWVGGTRRPETELALLRLGLPTAAREYALDTLSWAELLVTGMSEPERKLLRRTLQPSGEALAALPALVLADARSRPGAALLTGRVAELEELLHQLEGLPDGEGLHGAIGRALASLTLAPELRVGAERWELGGRTHVMGVVNVTPDSFSDGGAFLELDRAVDHGVALVQAGADLLDVGGESTRPGAAPVSAEEEAARVVPVIEALRKRVPTPLSVDTRKAAVARLALEAGACLVNDVSALADPALPRVVAEAGAGLCLMHMQGTPRTMQDAPAYEDVIDEVVEVLGDALARARAAGVAEERLLVDPGIGFGKSLGHNLFLLRRLPELRVLGRPILVGTSRKSFLGKLTGGKPPSERLWATLGSAAVMAVLGGADVVRVHDVAETRDVLAVADAVRLARDGGRLYD